MSRNHWVLLFVSAGVGLAWWAVGSDAPKPNAGQPAIPVEPASSPAGAPSRAPETAAPAAPAAQPPSDTRVQAPAPADPQAAASEETGIPLPGRSGPIDELRKLYESEPRASASPHIESIIEAHFRRNEVPPELLKSALCRTTVCRIETRWSPARAQGFMSAMMHLVTEPAGDRGSFDNQIGVVPETEAAADGSHTVEVFVRVLPKQP